MASWEAEAQRSASPFNYGPVDMGHDTTIIQLVGGPCHGVTQAVQRDRLDPGRRVPVRDTKGHVLLGCYFLARDPGVRQGDPNWMGLWKSDEVVLQHAGLKLRGQICPPHLLTDWVADGPWAPWRICTECQAIDLIPHVHGGEEDGQTSEG